MHQTFGMPSFQISSKLVYAAAVLLLSAAAFFLQLAKNYYLHYS